ncbi:patatin-like phospholipase family protein [Peptostreptococcus faecalis]|uniref:patatin-like phospholipase family protein n=1 Tax=Peptostreptococcus faecalis TaxID=2045015 RepID=UPI000C7E1AD9|nr:patatin family protein [Peptostreptococcus faecalis]
MNSNVKDIALIFEGGGMRASFSSGISNVLVENEIFFDYAAGISAGAGTVVNYLSRDIERTRKSFVDLADDPNMGGWASFLKGNGFFNSEYIYERSSLPGECLELDFEKLMKNPANFRMVAYDAINGQAKNFSKKDVFQIRDLMKIVRASSSLPILMPPTEINGNIYYDGGLTGGIPLDIAIKDGYKKFFIVRTREKSYRKKPMKYKKIIKARFKKYPKVAKAMINRHYVYNFICEQIERLEAENLAYVVYPEDMSISNMEGDKKKLDEMYSQGYRIGNKDLDRWKEFVFNNK